MRSGFSRLRPGALLLIAVIAGACKGSNNPPAESPPGGDTGQRITGRERIGWDQPAESASDLSSFRYAIYVDGSRSEVNDVTCAANASGGGFACSGRLPSMTPGAHVLELATYINNQPSLESARAGPLRVTVTGDSRPAEANPLVAGDRITTSDGVSFEASLVTDARDATDLALTADGRLLIAERGGTIVVLAPGAEPFRTAVNQADGELLAVAPAPDIARSGQLFVVQAAAGAFRVARYRLFEGQLIERMMVLPEVPASAQPSAALRFGPDAKLYAVFDDGGRVDAAARLSAWSGKVLRVNPDGSTPDDMPAASPVLWSNIAAPGGLDWTRDGTVLWIAERGIDEVERIRALHTNGDRPRRAGQRATYVLPPPVGASSLAFYRGDVPNFRDDLFIAARTGGYLLRVRFEESDRTRAVTTEKLLEGRLGGIRSVASSPDGTLLIGTDTAVWRLTVVR